MTQHSAPTPGDRVQPVIVISLLLAFLATLGAYVWLSHDGGDTGSLISAVVTILGLLGVGVHSESRARKTNATLATIQEQTNGVLDRKIRDGVRAVLAEFQSGTPHTPES